MLKIPSEEISRRVGKIVWAKSFSVGKIFEEIGKSPSMEAVSQGASSVPVQATLVPPRFLLDALKELEAMRGQELDDHRSFPVDMVIPLVSSVASRCQH